MNGLDGMDPVSDSLLSCGSGEDWRSLCRTSRNEPWSSSNLVIPITGRRVLSCSVDAWTVSADCPVSRTGLRFTVLFIA